MIFKTFTLIIINNLLKDSIVSAYYGCGSDAQLRSFSPRGGISGGLGFGVQGNLDNNGFAAQGGFGFGFGYGNQQQRPPQEEPVIPDGQWPNNPPNQLPHVPESPEEIGTPHDIGPSAQNPHIQYPSWQPDVPPQENQELVEPDIGPSANLPIPQEQPVLPPQDISPYDPSREQMPGPGMPELMPPGMPGQQQQPPLIAPQITLQPPSNSNNTSDDEANLPAVAEAPCDNPNLDRNQVNEMCSMPPDKGVGNDDVFRFYYNPIVQQCIPFSYSGKGGNANRFVSIKNCYEICMPAQPDIKNPVPSSGIQAYLVPAPSPSATDIAAPTRDLVVRQIPNPADPSKTLTIVQAAQYVMGGSRIAASIGAVIEDGTGTTRIVPTLPPKVKIVQHLHHPQYLSPAQPRSQFNPFNPSVDNECEDTIYVNSRSYNGYPRYNALSSMSYGK